MKIETAAELLYGWPKEKVKAVMKRNLLAQVDIEISLARRADKYATTVDVYGEREVGDRTRLADMTCEINGESVDNILPESLLRDIADRILAGEYD